MRKQLRSAAEAEAFLTAVISERKEIEAAVSEYKDFS